MSLKIIALRFILIGMLLVTLVSGIFAQPDVYVKPLRANGELSQGVVNDMLQDRQGFLWAGTKDGLNRHDGYSFKVFTNDPSDPWSISGNFIKLLFEDSAGRIWVATESEGISIYDKERGRFYRIPQQVNDQPGLTNGPVTSIVEDTSGVFIIGVRGKEINLLRLEDDNFITGKLPEITRLSMPVQENSGMDYFFPLRGIMKDAIGRIWVGGDSDLYQLDVKSRTLTLAHRGRTFEKGIPAPDGSCWMNGKDGFELFNWNGERAAFFPRLKYYERILDLVLHDSNTLYLLTTYRIFVCDLADWKPEDSEEMNAARIRKAYRMTNDRDEISMRSVVTDRSGVNWIGTNGFGLYRMYEDKLRFGHNLSGNSLRDIVVVDNERQYVQTFSGNWMVLTEPGTASLPIISVDATDSYNLLLSKAGELWIKQHHQKQPIFYLRRRLITGEEVELIPTGWRYDMHQPIIESKDGYLWLAAVDQGLGRLEIATGKLIEFDLMTGLQVSRISDVIRPGIFATALYEDGQGTFWYGSPDGLIKGIRTGSAIQPGFQVTHFTNVMGDDQSLSYNHVTHVLDDPLEPERYLWVATRGGGINRLDKATGKFLRLNKQSGLPDNVVYGLLADDDGNLWGSTNRGLFSLTLPNPQKGITDFVFRSFTKADGLQEDEFNTAAFAKAPDGRLFFGGVNGLSVFDPRAILTSEFLSPVYLTSIAVNNETLEPGDDSGILTSTAEKTRSITLSHLQNMLTLEFAALDFTASEQNKYRYQLVSGNQQEDWVEAGNRRSVTFMNLTPGKYLFRVQGTNAQGVWSDLEAELNIRVLPPWWKTWWAYLFYTLSIGAGILAYLRFNQRRARLKEELAFGKREAERIKELDTLKTRLYTNMTHEFRTPLTIILGMTRQLRDNADEGRKKSLEMIERNGHGLLQLVNKMLRLSKLESGKMLLVLVNGDIVIFLRTVLTSFIPLAESKGVQVHFLPDSATINMNFDAEKVEQLISNLLSNAIKFTPSGGQIYVVIRKEQNQLLLKVKDTGRGIPTKAQEKIFDRFYQVDDSFTRQYEGTGIGLAFCRELVKLMGGTISVISPLAGAKSGSEFIIQLPFTNSADGVVKPYQEPLETDKMNWSSINYSAPVPEPTVTARTVIAESLPPSVDQSRAQHLILLVEDNPDVVAYVASCLPDYQLVVAENGAEGLELATTSIPDLIITDVMMPVMDGFELCRRLRQDERTDHIPIIVLTARAALDSKLEGLEIGANVYLSKPFEQRELLLHIKNLFALREKIKRRNLGVPDPVDQQLILAAEDDPVDVEDAFVTKVKGVINDHLNDFDLSVELLAKKLLMSQSQLGRKLDALTGLSPNRYIRHLRLEKARNLLADPAHTITSVAYDCGFNDPSYFTRVFKKQFGTTPNGYRETLLDFGRLPHPKQSFDPN
jgi:signal transduction histidine kinase/CheY-like chemotaxis protein/ligand-binding sensor domain-containing protein